MPLRLMLTSTKTGMNSSALLLWLLRSFSGLVSMSMPIRTLRSHRASLAASLSFERCASACVIELVTRARSISRWDGSDRHAYAVTASVERLLEKVHDFVRLALHGAYGGRLRREGDEDGGEGAEGGGERDPEGLPSEVEVLVDAPDADNADPPNANFCASTGMPRGRERRRR